MSGNTLKAYSVKVSSLDGRTEVVLPMTNVEINFSEQEPTTYEFDLNLPSSTYTQEITFGEVSEDLMRVLTGVGQSAKSTAKSFEKFTKTLTVPEIDYIRTLARAEMAEAKLWFREMCERTSR